MSKKNDLYKKARELRKNMTNAEEKLWYSLRARETKNTKFRRQQPIGSYIVDFVSHEVDLVIEVDGGQHQRQKSYDRERTEWLDEKGYTVLRFWNDDVLTDTDTVLEEIGRTIERLRTD